jgi:hypothetical protein
MAKLDDFQSGSTNVLAVTTKINESREMKLKNYETIRRQVDEEKKKLLKSVDEEEFALKKQIDEEIADEKK